jgi:hypothetical protein
VVMDLRTMRMKEDCSRYSTTGLVRHSKAYSNPEECRAGLGGFPAGLCGGGHSGEKHFHEGSAEPQIPRLRSG